MTRLDSEWHRLFAPQGLAEPGAPEAQHGRSPLGPVRTLVLELAGPADWPRLSAVWQGVQSELDWPAPAIAVNGRDGHQLWFSLASPVPRGQAAAVVEGLRRRWLTDLAKRRVRCWPSLEEGLEADRPWPQPVPSRQVTDPEQWSAFVLPGLAPVFADDPWLDTPPNPDAQADLLSRLASISLAAWDQARPSLTEQDPAAEAPHGAPPGAATPSPPETEWPPATRSPREFLTSVMNDPQVPLALRIEAAKALLPGSGD